MNVFGAINLFSLIGEYISQIREERESRQAWRERKRIDEIKKNYPNVYKEQSLLPTHQPFQTHIPYPNDFVYSNSSTLTATSKSNDEQYTEIKFDI